MRAGQLVIPKISRAIYLRRDRVNSWTAWIPKSDGGPRKNPKRHRVKFFFTGYARRGTRSTGGVTNDGSRCVIRIIGREKIAVIKDPVPYPPATANCVDHLLWYAYVCVYLFKLWAYFVVCILFAYRLYMR